VADFPAYLNYKLRWLLVATGGLALVSAYVSFYSYLQYSNWKKWAKEHGWEKGRGMHTDLGEPESWIECPNCKQLAMPNVDEDDELIYETARERVCKFCGVGYTTAIVKKYWWLVYPLPLGSIVYIIYLVFFY